MMFKSTLVALLVAFAGLASAAPTPYSKAQAKLAARDIQVLGVRHVPVPVQAVQEIAVRGEHYMEEERRQIAEEVPTKSDNGRIVAYKRADVIPAEIAVKSDGNGGVVPYDKRSDAEISPVEKRAEVIPAEVAVKTDGAGNIVEYKRAEPIPLEIAVRTDANGNIVPYGRRA